MLSALLNDLNLGLIVTLVLAVMLTGSVHLMMVSVLVWVLSFLAQVTSVAVSALGKTQKRLYLYICTITGIGITEVPKFSYLISEN